MVQGNNSDIQSIRSEKQSGKERINFESRRSDLKM